ncbi:hypothetical protein L1987_11837 [Smallanthus sonchifolius]|uniref:Uncharacterized protein n=1 Tax=Smallanthus sonchifolius TaxID=185202 RepID=A0ACB9JE76_9ASTR|nr:hypothetical protein L1987_11837 [Smallanthus sonchifolius]
MVFMNEPLTNIAKSDQQKLVIGGEVFAVGRTYCWVRYCTDHMVTCCSSCRVTKGMHQYKIDLTPFRE